MNSTGSKNTSEKSPPILDIRYGQVGIVHVRVRVTDPGALIDDLSGRVAAAPQFFRRSAVCLDLRALDVLPEPSELRAVIDAVRRAGMLAIGLVGDSAGMEALASAVDLPVLPSLRAPGRPAPVLEPSPAPAGSVGSAGAATAASAAAAVPAAPAESAAPEEAVATAEVEAASTVGALVHPQAVRSGQRVYARQRDLIVVGGVAAGAEVMADGCLHIYGSLRGRAMAGARGEATARMFCQEFDAELISIAGVFRIFETIPADLRGKPVQAWLDGDDLRCARIGS